MNLEESLTSRDCKFVYNYSKVQNVLTEIGYMRYFTLAE